MEPAAIRDRAAELPREPGVYLFHTAGEGAQVPADGAGDADGRVLYVGKAVDIRDRVRTYADPRSERIRRMVARTDGVDYAVTDTETQALLLEANLIKRHQPRYNVRLKDDKSYPMVQLTAHEFPRIEVTRDPDEGATVFGPFTDVSATNTVVKGLRETYGVRGCSDHKFANRDRPCLDHDLGLCTAPCTAEIVPEAYAEDVAAVARFFEGETGVLADPLEREMERAAAEREFERAANLRDRLAAAESFHGGGGAAVVAREEQVVDVLGVAVEGESATVARLHSEDGKLVDRDRHPVAVPDVDASAAASRTAAVLAAFIPQFYAERRLPDALLLSEHPGDDDVIAWLEAAGVTVRVPGAGREATLVDLALKNARKPVGRGDEGAALAEALDLERVTRVEGFDVSHAGGRAVVGSNVTFVDGAPKKADYRRKKLPERNDDYANMRALLTWRARRAVEGRDDRPDPHLLVVDGGRGQLDAARAALREVGWDVPVVALAKERELVVTPGGTHDWPSDAPHLHLLQRVRDEAHRFAVQYHGTVRDDVSTALDEVPGIGPELRKRLLRRFGSVGGIRTASVAELRDVEGVGEKTAEQIVRAL